MSTTIEVIVLECPQCAAPVQKESKSCPKCYAEYMVRSVSKLRSLEQGAADKFLSAYRKGVANGGETVDACFSMGICFLEKKDYDRAIKSFEKAIDLYTEDADVYFHAAVALLKGKKAFLTPRTDIDKITEYLDEASRLESKGIYHYFLAYIKYDFFYRKHLNVPPNYQEVLEQAQKAGISPAEIDELYEVLGVSRPETL